MDLYDERDKDSQRHISYETISLISSSPTSSVSSESDYERKIKREKHYDRSNRYDKKGSGRSDCSRHEGGERKRYKRSRWDISNSSKRSLHQNDRRDTSSRKIVNNKYVRYSPSSSAIVPSEVPIPPKTNNFLTDLEVGEMMVRNSMLYGCDSDDEITAIKAMKEVRSKLAAQLKFAVSLKNKNNAPPAAVSDSPSKISVNDPAMKTDSKVKFNLHYPIKKDSTEISFWKAFDQVSTSAVDDDIFNKIIAPPKTEASYNKVYLVPKVRVGKDLNRLKATVQLDQSEDSPSVQDPTVRYSSVRNLPVPDSERVHSNQNKGTHYIPNYPPSIDSELTYPKSVLLPTVIHYPTNLDQHMDVIPIPTHTPPDKLNEIHTENCYSKQDFEEEQSKLRGFDDSCSSTSTGSVKTVLEPFVNKEKVIVSINLARIYGNIESIKMKEVVNPGIEETGTPAPSEENTEKLTTSTVTVREPCENIEMTQTPMKSNEKRTHHASMESDSDKPSRNRFTQINEGTGSLTNDKIRKNNEKGTELPVVPKVLTNHLEPDVANYLSNSKEDHQCVRLLRKSFVEFHQLCYFCNEHKCLTKLLWKNHMAKHLEPNHFKKMPHFKDVTVKAFICDMCDYVRLNVNEIEQHLSIEHKLDVTTNKFKEVTFLSFPKKKRNCQIKKRAKKQRKYIGKRKEDVYKEEECTSTLNEVKSTPQVVQGCNEVKEQTMIGQLDRPTNDENIAEITVVENEDGPTEQIRVEVDKDDAIRLIQEQLENEAVVSTGIHVDDEDDGFSGIVLPNLPIIDETNSSDLLTFINETDASDLFNFIDETESSDLLTFIDDYIESQFEEPEQLPSTSIGKVVSGEENDIGMVSLKAWNKDRTTKLQKHCKVMLSDICLYALYKCMDTNCAFTTDNAENMLTHLQNHEKSTQTNAAILSSYLSYLECSYCDVVIDTCTTLVKHIQEEHQSSIFQCPFCFYRSCVAYNVVVHLNQFHQSEEKSMLVCNGTPRSYTTEKALIQKSLMENIRPLRCVEDCNKITYAMDYFVKHLTNSTAHTDKFKCQFCGFNILVSDTAKHLLVHGVGVYECIYCHYGINDVKLIQDHMCNSHPSKLLYICVRLTQKNRNLSDAQLRSVESTLVCDLDRKCDDELFRRCPYTVDQSSYMLLASNSNETPIPSLRFETGLLRYEQLKKDYMADDWDKYFAKLEYMTDKWDEHFATLSATQPSTLITVSSTTHEVVENTTQFHLQQEVIQSSPSKRRASTTQTMVDVTENKKSCTSALRPDLIQDDIDNAAYFLVKGTGAQDLYRCSFAKCEKKSKDVFEFFCHRQTHNQHQIGFKCYNCGALSKNIVAYKEHVKVHGMHRYFCYFCSYTGAIENDVQKHIQLKHHRHRADLITIPLNPKKRDAKTDLFVIYAGLRRDLRQFFVSLIQRSVEVDSFFIA